MWSRPRRIRSRHMLDPDLVRELLASALSTGGRFAELFAEERGSTSLRLDDGRIEEVVEGSDRGAGIRVFHGESQSYAFSNRLDAASLREVATAAASAVRNGGPGVTPVDLRRSEPLTHPEPKPANKVPVDRKVAWLREPEEAARSVDPAVRQVLAVHADSRQRILVANSDGQWAEETRPRLRLGAPGGAMR